MKIIGTKENDVIFKVYSSFNSKLFSPIGNYVNWKLENKWDDYNELFHAINYIENLKKTDGIWYEIHTIERNEKIKGVLTIVGGDIDKLEITSNTPKETTILLKYFHIIEKGKGYGSYWLQSVIMPYYANKGYCKILINSSHPKSFDFYKKMGSEVKSYVKKSDNNLFERQCKSFLISID